MTFKWNVPFKGHLRHFLQVLNLVTVLDISGNSIKHHSLPLTTNNATSSVAATTISTPATSVSIPDNTARVPASTATVTFFVVAFTSIGWYQRDCRRHGGYSHCYRCNCSATEATSPATTTAITNLCHNLTQLPLLTSYFAAIISEEMTTLPP